MQTYDPMITVRANELFMRITGSTADSDKYVTLDEALIAPRVRTS